MGYNHTRNMYRLVTMNEIELVQKVEELVYHILLDRIQSGGDTCVSCNVISYRFSRYRLRTGHLGITFSPRGYPKRR